MYLGARDQFKAEAAIQQLETEGLGPYYGQVIWHKVDYENPRWAKESAEEFMAREERLDVLSEQLIGKPLDDAITNLFFSK